MFTPPKKAVDIRETNRDGRNIDKADGLKFLFGANAAPRQDQAAEPPAQEVLPAKPPKPASISDVRLQFPRDSTMDSTPKVPPSTHDNTVREETIVTVKSSSVSSSLGTVGRRISDSQVTKPLKTKGIVLKKGSSKRIIPVEHAPDELRLPSAQDPRTESSVNFLFGATGGKKLQESVAAKKEAKRKTSEPLPGKHRRSVRLLKPSGSVKVAKKEPLNVDFFQSNKRPVVSPPKKQLATQSSDSSWSIGSSSVPPPIPRATEPPQPPTEPSRVQATEPAQSMQGAYGAHEDNFRRILQEAKTPPRFKSPRILSARVADAVRRFEGSVEKCKLAGEDNAKTQVYLEKMTGDITIDDVYLYVQQQK